MYKQECWSFNFKRNSNCFAKQIIWKNIIYRQFELVKQVQMFKALSHSYFIICSFKISLNAFPMPRSCDVPKTPEQMYIEPYLRHINYCANKLNAFKNCQITIKFLRIPTMHQWEYDILTIQQNVLIGGMYIIWK